MRPSRPVRPLSRVAVADLDQTEWVTNYAEKAAELVRLQGRAQRGEIVLLDEDEVDRNLLPGVVRGWTRRGEQHVRRG